MSRLLALGLVSVTTLSGCGFLADAVSDKLALDFNHDLIKPANIGESKVEPLTFNASMSAASPTQTLPADANTKDWTSVLIADRARRAEGKPGIFAITIDSFALTGDYVVQYTVRPFSRTGLVSGQPRDAVLSAPASCSFSLNPDTATGTDYGQKLTTCVTQWVDMNGVPYEFDMEVTTAQGGPARQTTSYSLSYGQTMSANQAISHDFTCRLLKGISSDVLDNIDSIEFSRMSLTGMGSSSKDVTLDAEAMVFTTDGVIAQASLHQGIGAGQRYWISSAMTTPPQGTEQYTLMGTAVPVLTPGMPDFVHRILEAAALAEGLEPGDPTAPVGCVDWTVAGDWPRDGFVTVQMSGEGKPSFD